MLSPKFRPVKATLVTNFDADKVEPSRFFPNQRQVEGTASKRYKMKALSCFVLRVPK